ncbi:DUF4085 family protein [Bacillus sp. PS06]|uniref:DUF4085 family protein n=1 Tax=Bacillus sp. PS06 TaxID=2764176 RepID=UPI0017828602|nr:DUF4085 family protein [Bacillus sp. PS06]MBD8069573.1 DUF4085 family protein [Bacillus sp. PS06]
MWNVSKEAKEKFLKCNLLPIPESDEEWEITLREAKEEGEDLIGRLKTDLEEVRAELRVSLPDRFIPYVEDGTLNQPSLPKSVREDYLQWMRAADQEFEQILDAALEQKNQAVPFLSNAVQEVFADSLHDSTIERIEREAETLHIYINTDGGFSPKSLIHLTFNGISSEETDVPLQVGQWFIYDELQKNDEGFAFRVLFECPESQWTIMMKDLDARYFYRPKKYTSLQDSEELDRTSLTEYISTLDPERNYWFITPDVEFAFHSLTGNLVLENGSIEIVNNEINVISGTECYSYNLKEYNPIKFIYTDNYEDPYEHMNEPVPINELEEAALNEDLEWQVRAWNTMYSNPIELAGIINRVLMKIEVTEDIEMMLSVYVSHFYKNEILSDDVIRKYREFID